MEVTFSNNGYHDFLKLLKAQGTEFLLSKDLPLKDSKKPQIFLRHDIDADLSAADKMATIEYNLGVRSTYFVMVRSCVYNLFTENNHNFVKNILSKNHDIGLHFDLAFSKEYYSDLITNVKWETELLENAFDFKISSLSYHQPDAETIQRQIEYENIKSVYNFKKTYGLEYYSDSNLDKNRINTFISDFKKDQIRFKAQLLIHPMWWINNSGNFSTEEVWQQTLLQNFQNCQKHLVKYERAYGSQKSLYIQKSLK